MTGSKAIWLGIGLSLAAVVPMLAVRTFPNYSARPAREYSTCQTQNGVTAAVEVPDRPAPEMPLACLRPETTQVIREEYANEVFQVRFR